MKPILPGDSNHCCIFSFASVYMNILLVSRGMMVTKKNCIMFVLKIQINLFLSVVHC